MLREKLAEDLKTAMKSADPKTVGVLRLLISAINNKAIEKRTKTGSDVLTDDEVLQTLNGEAKKRKESVEIFIKGNRADLAEKEKGELEIIQNYLPKLMNREETEKAVDRILASAAPKDIGLAMKEVMKELRGKADSAIISELVKQKISK